MGRVTTRTPRAKPNYRQLPVSNVANNLGKFFSPFFLQFALLTRALNR
jgi:hypothetical protein